MPAWVAGGFCHSSRFVDLDNSRKGTVGTVRKHNFPSVTIQKNMMSYALARHLFGDVDLGGGCLFWANVCNADNGNK